VLGEFGYRFTGSSDLYQGSARVPHASINFLTAHDGFTLRDLVSYNEKHNEANGEEGRDGESHNRSWNCGEEGETDNPEVLALRKRQQRNLLATLFFSQGVPMLLGGDEMGRTQGGNNNAYCQDNETSWFDWQNVDHELLDFTCALIKFYRAHPVFQRRGWFQKRAVHSHSASTLHDIGWFTAEGVEMSDEHWATASANIIGVFLNGEGIATPDDYGQRVTDASFYLMLNAHHEPTTFRFPNARWGERWTQVMTSERGFVSPRTEERAADEALELDCRTLAVWQRVTEG
jgi:glycogen operon protein